MTTAAPGHEVFVEYKGLLENGEVFDSTEDSGTLQFVIGTGSVMPLFEECVIGMQEKEEREVTIPPEDAFGLRQEELVQTMNKNSFGDRAAELKEGVVLNLNIKKDGEQHTVPALVTKIAGDQVTVDYNHPLAGQTICYKISMVKIGEKKTNLAPTVPVDAP